MPKKLKYRRPFKIIPKLKRAKIDKLYFGAFGLLAVENGLLTHRQIEAARKTIVGYMKRKGRLWIRIFPDRPITKKPAEVKMGSGKGDVDHYAAIVKKGNVLFEIGGVDESVAKEAFRRASHKLPLRVKFIKSDVI